MEPFRKRTTRNSSNTHTHDSPSHNARPGTKGHASRAILCALIPSALLVGSIPAAPAFAATAQSARVAQSPQSAQSAHSPQSTQTAAVIKTAANIQRAFSTFVPSSYGFNESFPAEQGGVLYVTTSQASVMAMDAKTGQMVWRYDPTLNIPSGIPEANRGVAIGGSMVYVLTADDQLIGLERATGKVVFDVVVANVKEGYFETMTPLVADNRVFVGASGGDQGLRGFVSAFDAKTGKFQWKFYTVPDRGSGWVPATGSHGGGAVWTTPTYDSTTQSILFGTGNPSPDYYGQGRPGADLYTDSVVSLNAKTGKLHWYQQEVPHDLWDYDVASPPILFTAKGQPAVGEAGKDGYWYEWNRKTGKPLTNPTAFVKEDHRPPTAKGVLEWPGPGGGANYGPSAYDPVTKYAFVAGINGPETVWSGPTKHKGNESDFGTHQNPAPKSDWSGTLTAFQTDTGKIRWQVKLSAPPIGGVTNDGDGTVSVALPDGSIQVYSAKNGQLVWETSVGIPFGSPPVAYELGGHRYLAVVTGGSASLSNLYPWSGANKLIAYKLN